MDLLHPNIPAEVKQKREQQKDHHNQHLKPRDLNKEEKVFVKEFSEGKTWLPGTIAKSEGKITYILCITGG